MPDPLSCAYYDDHRCRSCTSMGVPHLEQVRRKMRRAHELLDTHAPVEAWLPVVAGRSAGFRNKAKMAVGGTTAHPTLGILDRQGNGVDLRGCAITDERITAALTPVAEMIADAGLIPYDVPGRRGELKYVLVTVSPDGELLVRFVLRSRAHVEAIRAHLPRLLATVPGLAVVSVNIHPEHKAVLEGAEEIVLTERAALPMRLPGDVTLSLPVRSFFQTNTEIAAAMYAQAAAWGCEVSAHTAWDLYCGVGGFTIALATVLPERVTGVEVSPDAVAAAKGSAAAAGLDNAAFVAADAASWAAGAGDAPDLLVVNPPRRGLGAELAEWIERSAATSLIYSSCNAVTLSTDLGRMPSWEVERVRLFDMFPQSSHFETMVRARRRG